MKAEILERWGCPNCAKVYDEPYKAERCCPIEADDVYLCSICEEKFFSPKLAEDHLKVSACNQELTPSEVYAERLLFGRPGLGEWATTMEYETDFLIPVR